MAKRVSAVTCVKDQIQRTCFLSGIIRGTVAPAEMEKPMEANVIRAFAARAAVVMVVFTALGFATALVVFSHETWSSWALAGIAAGFGGVTGWAIACGRLGCPAWWRAAVAGLLAGVLLHPYYWFLAASTSYTDPSPSNILQGSLLSLMVIGVVTVPVGLGAALCCRGLFAVFEELGWDDTLEEDEPR